MLINGCYESIRSLVEKNSGFDNRLCGTDEYKSYASFMQLLRGYNGQKVSIKYKASSDWHTSKGEKVGRIKVDGEKVLFFEGRKKTKFQYLDGGLYDGFYAVLIPMEIEAI